MTHHATVGRAGGDAASESQNVAYPPLVPQYQKNNQESLPFSDFNLSLCFCSLLYSSEGKRSLVVMLKSAARRPPIPILRGKKKITYCRRWQHNFADSKFCKTDGQFAST